MKKFLIILLSLTLALGMFTACGGGKKSKEVTVTLVGENQVYEQFFGTIEIVGTNGATTGKFEKGTTITLKYTPANGTEILSWSAGDEELGDTNEIQYTVGSNDVTITVLEGNVDKSFTNVVFEDATVSYNRGNAVPAVIYDAPETPETVTYVVKKDGVEIGSVASEVGTYEVTVTIEAEGYQTFTKTITLTIVNGTLNIEVVNTTVQYDPANAKAINVINVFDGIEYTITYTDANGEVVAAPQNAGVYTATLTATCENYNEKTSSATLTIEKLNGVINVPDVMEVEVGTVVSVANIANITLNNNEQTLDVKMVNAAGQEVTETSTAGVYTVIVNAAASANYNAAVEKRFYIAVLQQGGGASSAGEGPASRDEFNQLVAGATFVGATYDYNGAEQSITTITGLEDYPYEYTVAYKTNFAINAGTYAASAYITDKATGFNKELKATLIITPAPLTVKAGVYEDVVQGSQLPNIMDDVVYEGLQGDDTADSLGGRLILDYSFDRKTHHSDTPYEIKVSGLTSPNYEITFVNGSYEIVLPTFTPTPWAETSAKLTPANTEDVVYGLQYNGDVTSLTTLYGEEFYGMGVNFFSMMGGASAKSNFDATDAIEHINILGSYNTRAFRFSLMPFYARQYDSFTDYYGSYIKYLDDCVNACEKAGVGMIVSFYWTSAIQDLYDEGTAIALRDPESKTWDLMARYTAFIVDRYKNSPALFVWEFGNEYNLACEVGGLGDLPAWSKRPSRTEAEDKMTAQTMNTVYKRWVDVIYDNDPSHRLIANGDAVYRTGQNGQAFKDQASSGGDTLDNQYHIANFLNPEGEKGEMNAISWHVYAGVASNQEGREHIAGYYSNNIPIESWEDFMTHMMTMGKSMNKTCYFGECGTGADGTIGLPGDKYNYTDQKRVIDALGDAMMRTHFPLALLWNYDPVGYLPPDRGDEHSLGTEWSWCIEEQNDKGFFFMTSLKETNDAIDAGAATATRVATPVRG